MLPAIRSNAHPKGNTHKNASTLLAGFALSAIKVAAIAADSVDSRSGSKAATASKNVCKKGKSGGVVESNTKLPDGSYVTFYLGDEGAWNTPADHKESVAKLKTGDKNCMYDYGS